MGNNISYGFLHRIELKLHMIDCAWPEPPMKFSGHYLSTNTTMRERKFGNFTVFCCSSWNFTRYSCMTTKAADGVFRSLTHTWFQIINLNFNCMTKLLVLSGPNRPDKKWKFLFIRLLNVSTFFNWLKIIGKKFSGSNQTELKNGTTRQKRGKII